MRTYLDLSVVVNLDDDRLDDPSVQAIKDSVSPIKPTLTAPNHSLTSS